jgi:quercetin dioxygenase-like cupin family protein
MVYLTNIGLVEEKELNKGDAKNTTVKYIIDERQGAERFFLRIYTVMPGGKTPYDRHNYEHEVFVLEGSATLVTVESGVEKKYKISAGDAIYIGPNEVHQFVNDSNKIFRMLCIRGSEIQEETKGC